MVYIYDGVIEVDSGLIGQNDSQREGNKNYTFPCTLREGKYPSYTQADTILKYT